MKDGQTIGQWLKWDFELNGPIEINNKNDKLIYWEDFSGWWYRWEYNSQGEVIYHERSDGYIKDHRIPEIFEHPNGRKYKLIP
jgi:hypothetical protein